MTRIAAGHPAIWLDICTQNRTAIVGVLDRLIGVLGEIREIVKSGSAGPGQGVRDRARVAQGKPADGGAAA